MNNDDWACYCCDMCKETERERIIKLLTPIRQRFMGKGLEEEIIADTLHDVITLIKGENK